MKKVEILAPCGNIESAYAAIQASADAIYLGGKMFGARSFANNFSNEDIIKVINYAHLYGVKVYVTCNILIYENEVLKFLEFIEFLHKNNVDAVIMQDLGMIDLVHKTFPNLEIHGSTQMHIHNLEGAKIAKKLGLKRIVIARETPIEVIQDIKEKTGLEIEIFVHGALCVSYSGMCLFARSIGPRSGNRGTCTGCCRLPYDILNNKGKKLNHGKFPLSMKDLNTLEYLDKLLDSGVDSFKIEGRMKSPSYVYTVTKLYKETSDYYLKTNKIKINQEDLLDLKTIFNREYTKGYLLNEDNNQVINMSSSNNQGILIGQVINSTTKEVTIKLTANLKIHDGIRLGSDYGLTVNEFYQNKKQIYEASNGDIITLKVNKKIPLHSQVLKTFSIDIENKVQEIITKQAKKIPIFIEIKILKNKPITLTVTDYQETITMTSIIPSLALNNKLTKEVIKEKISKVQNTSFKIAKLEITLDNDLFVPISLINNLKRDILNQLTKKRINRFKKEFQKEIYFREVPDFKKQQAYTLLTNQETNSSKYKFIYSETLTNYIKKLPKVMPSYQDYLDNREYLVGEIGGLTLKNIITDYSLNVTNSYTVAILHSLGVKRVTLSLELLDKQIENLIKSYLKRYQKRPNLELIIKTRMEVMVLKFQYSKYFHEPVAYLVDRFQNKYKIIEKNNLTYIYDYKKLELFNPEKYFQMGINYLREEDYES